MLPSTDVPRVEAELPPASAPSSSSDRAVPQFVAFRLVLLLVAGIAGTEGYLTLQGGTSALHEIAGHLGFLVAAVLFSSAIMIEPFRALIRRLQ